jgi:hypothetical protein
MAHQFIKTAFQQLKKRFPLANSTLMCCDCVLMRNEKDLETLGKLALQFSTLFTHDEARELEMELKKIKNEDKFLEELHQVATESVMEIWFKWRNNHPKLFRLVQAIQVFPYSTAQAKREFSILEVTKNPRKDRLTIENLEAALIIKQEDNSTVEEILGEELLQKFTEGEGEKAANPEKNAKQKEVRDFHFNLTATSRKKGSKVDI